MLCAISNAVPENPVVSTKTGHVYEKSLIEKYLDEKGTCPMTGKEMNKDDILELKMGKPVKPRHTPAMSIPGILGMLHNEYDSLMLETFELRTALRNVRKDLSTALYNHDAACRIIARLTSEKDAAEGALEDLQAQIKTLSAQQAQAPVAGPSEGPPNKRAREEEGLSDEAAAEMDEKRQALFQARKARNPEAELPGLASVTDIETLSCTLSQPLHSPSQPGILALALPPSDPLTTPPIVATAGADHSVQVFDTAEGVVAATLTGHSKKVSALTYAGSSVLVSGSVDKTVRAWRPKSDDPSSWSCAYTFEAPAPVVQACTHPVSRFVVAICANGFWSMMDVEAARAVWRVQDTEMQEYSCGAMHPDGNFFAAGGPRGGLRLFDMRSAPLMSISEQQGIAGAVRSVAFNENGYWAALACDEGVQVWDLRKVNKVAAVSPFDEPPTCLTWDYSGRYLACGGPAIKIYSVTGRKKTEIQVIKSLHDLPKGGVNSLQFGALSKSLFVAAADHNLRLYTC